MSEVLESMGGVGPSSMDERDLGAGDVSRRMGA